MSTDPVIDPKALELLRSLDQDRPGAMIELVRLFITDAPVQMQRLEEGYRDRDGEQVRQAAHFLRSGALALGLTGMIDTSQVIEHLDISRYGEPESEAALAALRVESRNAVVALLSVVDSL